MSTSEFESQFEESEFPADLFTYERTFPDDFSDEDRDFARAMEALFLPDQEEMPPLFVQTLMAAEDPSLQPVEPAFEKKTSARVFRQLRLKRRLFRPARFSLYGVLSALSMSRSLVAITTACAFFMFLTMVFTGPSFASGLNILWAGAHSGVLLVDHYPQGVSAPHHAAPKKDAEPHPQVMNLVDAQQLLKFPLSLPQYIPENYTQSDIYLYQSNQGWADGPVVVLDYSYALPGVPPRQLAICEFKPQGNAFQVVQNGAAQQIQIGPDGSPAGIYVVGQWTQDSTSTPSWVYSDRSELIYPDPKTGVVYWIVGDSRGGITDAVLQKIAASLYPFTVSNNHMEERLNQVIQGESGVPWAFANDVIYLDNPDNSGGPSFRLVGADANTVPAQPHPTRSSPNGS